MLKDYSLTFSMNLEESRQLIYGNLALEYPDGETINYLATSGCPGWQSKKDLWMRARGPIPDDFEYRIPTKPYYSETKGIEGWFFHLTPDPVRSASGIARGEFGIHFDSNRPGSSGCIVLINKPGFEGFVRRMEVLLNQGVGYICPFTKKVAEVVNQNLAKL